MRPSRGLSHVHVGLAARARRRDGPAQRARPLHPSAGGCLALGGAGRRRSPRRARRRRTRSSTRPATRSTGTRRSTTPRGGGAPVSTAVAGTTRLLPWPTTRWSPPSGSGSGSPRPRSSRRTSRSATSRSTCSARRARCCPYAGALDDPARTEDDLAYLRDERSSATCTSSSARTATSRVTMARLLILSTYQFELYDRAPGLDRPDAGGRRRQGGQGGRLPPRPRHAVGAPARRRHRGVARADAGGARRRVAVRRRALRRPLTSTPRWSRPVSPSTRRGCAPAFDAGSVGRARRGHAERPADRRPAHRRPSRRCTPRRWATCSPRCSASPARTRERRGDRRDGRPATRACERRRRRCSTPRCRC